MLLRDLKRVANDCCFNPKKPNKSQKITLDVGNPAYWTIKAQELIRQAQELAERSTAYNKCLEEATSLLILTRAYLDEQAANTKSKKTRKPAAGQDSSSTKTP